MLKMNESKQTNIQKDTVKIMYFMLALACLAFVSGCSGKKRYRSSCAANLSAAWQELDNAKAKGFAGTVSYTKALGQLSLAKSMQAVENFDNCVEHAKDARYYISQAKIGQ